MNNELHLKLKVTTLNERNRDGNEGGLHYVMDIDVEGSHWDIEAFT